MPRHLLTGTTGLVGGAVALELLERTDDELYCLVRGADATSARQRLLASLSESAVGYGRADLLPALADRVVPVWGDISEEGCGVVSALPQVEQVWHCAASLRYEEHYRDEILQQNVEGTRHVLDLARASGAAVFNHVSTAYVAGRASGRVLEGEAPGLEAANNCYEESKILGERLVTAETGMHVRVMRPSIVVGHSATLHATSFSGMYGFARLALFLRQTAGRRYGVDPRRTPLTVVAEPLAQLNLVPVDTVARNAVTIGLSQSAERYFHLTNAQAPSVALVVAVIHELLGMPRATWARSRDGLNAMDVAFDEAITFYSSYMRTTKEFDRTHADAVCGEGSSDVAFTRADIAAHVEHFLLTQKGYGATVPGPRVPLSSTVTAG
ncbi:male sterility protein [Motilibacter peucedani]|uniref:Male sterility protein n=1 Tax=Motilibacter peucedani TaxID=598650 RepID=A0A420XSU2_9ACTN|nr:SDR family oxidoreductase [Motilibacter peucedani]RKS77900.1 male sterility protein [Motilibacter peucedani]